MVLWNTSNKVHVMLDKDGSLDGMPQPSVLCDDCLLHLYDCLRYVYEALPMTTLIFSALTVWPGTKPAFLDGPVGLVYFIVDLQLRF